jgi:hypothetical protein
MSGFLETDVSSSHPLSMISSTENEDDDWNNTHLRLRFAKSDVGEYLVVLKCLRVSSQQRSNGTEAIVVASSSSIHTDRRYSFCPTI